MPILETDGKRVVIVRGRLYGEWTLLDFSYNHPGAQFGKHLFTFERSGHVLHVSDVNWSGDKIPCMFEGRWIPCPKELRDFGNRHSRVIYEIVPVLLKRYRKRMFLVCRK